MEEYHESAPVSEHTTEHNAEHYENRPYGQEKEPLPYAVPFSIVLAAIIIAGAIMFTGRNDSGGANKKLTAQAGDTVISAGDFKTLEANAPVLGNPDAPVVIVEFADYQCPFCGKFFQTTGKDIIEKYVKTGKARFIYHDFAFLGDESNWSAQAARCAGDQGKYWQYHDYLFMHQKGENQGAFSKDHLKSFALELGLKSSDFNKCLDAGTYAKAVADDTAVGRKFGVNGTPATFVNGKLVQGAVPFSAFEPIIEDAFNGK